MPASIAIPLLAVLSGLWSSVFALPVWLLWTACGLGARYFAFLPAAWQSMPMLHVIGLFLLVSVTRTALSPIRFELETKSRLR